MSEIQENKLIRNGVEVQLKNPGTRGLKDFLVLARAMQKMPQDEPERFLEFLDNDAMDAAINLINITMDKTYPNKTDDDDAWAMENAMIILPKVIEMCSPKLSDDDKRKEKLLERLKSKDESSEKQE